VLILSFPGHSKLFWYQRLRKAAVKRMEPGKNLVIFSSSFLLFLYFIPCHYNALSIKTDNTEKEEIFLLENLWPAKIWVLRHSWELPYRTKQCRTKWKLTENFVRRKFVQKSFHLQAVLQDDNNFVDESLCPIRFSRDFKKLYHSSEIHQNFHMELSKIYT